MAQDIAENRAIQEMNSSLSEQVRKLTSENADKAAKLKQLEKELTDTKWTLHQTRENLTVKNPDS